MFTGCVLDKSDTSRPVWIIFDSLDRISLICEHLEVDKTILALGATTTYPRGAWEYHEHLINESAVKPLRVFLEAAQNDNSVANVTHGLTPALTSYYGWLTANQNMAAVLKAKGYHYRYIYAAGAGHADGNVISQTLPEALLWLRRGYPIN